MTLAPHSLAVRHSTTNRSRVTNGTRILEGIDGRSATARRYRDLTTAFAEQLGGEASLTEGQRALVRQAAGLTVQNEALLASIVRGETVDSEQLTRLTNSVTRILVELGLKRRERKKQTLADYLAEKGQRAPA